MIVASRAEAIRCHQPRLTLFIVVSNVIMPRPPILIVASRAEAICCHQPRSTLFILWYLVPLRRGLDRRDSLECRTAIYLLAGAIHQLPCRHFSRGRLNPPNAALPFFNTPALSSDCHATIFQETGSIPWLLPCHFSRGRHYLQIAAPPFLKRPT